jgi:hypothetical protein
MRTRVLVGILIALFTVGLVGILPGARTAFAWNAFYRWVDVGAVSCTADGFTTGNQTVEWNGEGDSTATLESFFNGMGQGEGAPSSIPVGPGSQVFGGLNIVGLGTGTFTYNLVYRTYWGDGTLIYTSTLSISCSGGTATISNADNYVEGGAGGASGGSSRPGPDIVSMPSWSVMGTFVTTTPLYFAPNDNAASRYVIEAGKSLWVTGRSPDGQFYQVVLSGRFLWVPVGTLGTTFDHVWHGQALPTQTLK